MHKLEETMMNSHTFSLVKIKHLKEACWKSHKKFPTGMKDELKPEQKSKKEILLSTIVKIKALKEKVVGGEVSL